jgi:hypothetical protein
MTVPKVQLRLCKYTCDNLDWLIELNYSIEKVVTLQIFVGNYLYSAGKATRGMADDPAQASQMKVHLLPSPQANPGVKNCMDFLFHAGIRV